MHGTYGEVWVDTYMAMLRVKHGALKEKADAETGFIN